MTDTAEQQASMPWLAWAPRKTWEEVRVRLRSRDGNEWEELASDFQYWIQSADGQMCGDVVAFQIVGETPLDLASVSSASEDAFLGEIHKRTPTGAWIAVQHHPDGDWSVAEHPLPWLPGQSPEPVPATNQAGEVEWRGMEDAPRDGSIIELRSALRLNRSEFRAAYMRPIGLVAKAWVPVRGQSVGDLPWKDHEVEAWRPALATQPATSQEGEGTLANPSTFGKPTFGLAATPMPPTLSEDLRALVEALQPLADLYLTGSEPDDECAIDASDFPNAGHVRAARAALARAQVKAS